MKKILAFTLICASLLALASCADIDATASESTNTTSIQTTAPAQDLSEKKEYYENGNVKTLTLYDKDGNIASVAKYNKLGYCTAEYSYDSKGKVILEKTFEDFDENGVARIQNVYEPTSAMTVVTAYSEDRTYIERITSYNEDYLPVKDEYWNAENKLLKYDLYEYHDNLNIKSISYYKNGEKDAFVTYDKNGVLLSSKESGQPVKIYFYNENGELEETKEHIYSVGETVQVQKYFESGNLLYSLDYEINELGSTLKSRTDFTDDSGKSFIKTVYEYKKDGSLSRTISYNEKDLLVAKKNFGKYPLNDRTFYEYNKKDLLVKKEIYYGEQLESYTLYEYYESGALHKIVYYFYYEYIDGVYTNKTFLTTCSEYYENGNRFKETYYKYGILNSEEEYDISGLHTKDIRYYENGLIYSETLYENGDRCKSIEYYENGNVRSVEEHISYFDSIKKLYTIDGEYDGRIVKEGDYSFTKVRTYDAEGNLISVKEYPKLPSPMSADTE